MKQGYRKTRSNLSSHVFVHVLAFLVGCSSAARNEIYEVDAPDIGGNSLRGKSFSRYRTSSQEQDHNLKRDLKEGWRPLPREEPDTPDSTILGLIENRRFNAMEALFDTERLIFALRVDTGMSMSMSMSMIMDIDMGMDIDIDMDLSMSMSMSLPLVRVTS